MFRGLRIKLHDAIKKKWCEQHGLPLLAIPHWDYDKIDDLMKHFLMEMLNENSCKV
jgi:hypothetical protein